MLRPIFLAFVGYHILFVIVLRCALSAVEYLDLLLELFAFETYSVNYCSDICKISSMGFEKVLNLKTMSGHFSMGVVVYDMDHGLRHLPRCIFSLESGQTRNSGSEEEDISTKRLLRNPEIRSRLGRESSAIISKCYEKTITLFGAVISFLIPQRLNVMNSLLLLGNS